MPPTHTPTIEAFLRTMHRLNKGLRVRSIASTHLVTISPDEDQRHESHNLEVSLFQQTPEQLVAFADGLRRGVQIIDQDRTPSPAIVGRPA